VNELFVRRLEVRVAQVYVVELVHAYFDTTPNREQVKKNRSATLRQSTRQACYALGMTITIQLPDGIDEALARQAEREAREVIGVRLYEAEHLSHGQLAKFPGIGRGQVDEVLGRRGVAESLTPAEVAAQAEMLGRMRSTAIAR
jgi:predicted HTH domain antitoxin